MSDVQGTRFYSYQETSGSFYSVRHLIFNKHNITIVLLHIF